MPFQINGKDILRIAEIISKDSYTGKSTFFDNTKVTIPSVVDTTNRVADAPSGYFWTKDFLTDGKMLKSGSVSTASRKGCRPQWRHRFTVSAGSYSFYSFITTNSMQNPTMQDFCYYLSMGGGSAPDHRIMEVEMTDDGHWSKGGYVFCTAQAAGGSGADSNGKIGGWSGGGGGGGAFAAFVVLAHGMEFKVGSTITMGQLPESQCTVNCGGGASKNSGGSGGTVVIENDSDYKDWKVLDSRTGSNGGGSDNAGAGMPFLSFSHCPEGGLTFPATTGGSSGSGGGGRGGSSGLSNGANGGGGNGGGGGTGAGGGGASWVLFGTQYGGAGGASEFKIYY